MKLDIEGRDSMKKLLLSSFICYFMTKLFSFSVFASESTYDFFYSNIKTVLFLFMIVLVAFIGGSKRKDAAPYTLTIIFLCGCCLFNEMHIYALFPHYARHMFNFEPFLWIILFFISFSFIFQIIQFIKHH